MKPTALLLLAACNQIYGLDDTRLAGPVPPDAPPACQPALAFDRRYEQALLVPCQDYVPAADADRALASCNAGGRAYFAEGPIGKPLVEVDVETRPGMVRGAPRLAPEGDRAIIQHFAVSVTSMYSVHERDATGWRWKYDLPLIAEFDDSVGTPSRRPNAHILHARPNVGLVDEYVEDAPDAWRLARSYTTDELGTRSLYTVFNLTADGLQVIYQQASLDGTLAISHAWRDSVDARFGPGVALDGIPRRVFDAFMTNDCGRVYFSGLSSIFYARQL